MRKPSGRYRSPLRAVAGQGSPDRWPSGASSPATAGQGSPDRWLPGAPSRTIAGQGSPDRRHSGSPCSSKVPRAWAKLMVCIMGRRGLEWNGAPGSEAKPCGMGPSPTGALHPVCEDRPEPGVFSAGRSRLHSKYQAPICIRDHLRVPPRVLVAVVSDRGGIWRSPLSKKSLMDLTRLTLAGG